VSLLTRCCLRCAEVFSVARVGFLVLVHASLAQVHACSESEAILPARPPLVQNAFESKDLYFYCGHGDGGRYLSGEELQRLPRCPATVLMGCSSGVLKQQAQCASVWLCEWCFYRLCCW
jgi:hypothetical protein